MKEKTMDDGEVVDERKKRKKRSKRKKRESTCGSQTGETTEAVTEMKTKMKRKRKKKHKRQSLSQNNSEPEDPFGEKNDSTGDRAEEILSENNTAGLENDFHANVKEVHKENGTENAATMTEDDNEEETLENTEEEEEEIPDKVSKEENATDNCNGQLDETDSE